MIGLKLKRKIRIPGRGYVSGDIVTDKRTAAYLIAMSAAVEDELIPVEKADTADACEPVEAVEPIAPIEAVAAVAAVEVVEPPVRKAGRPRKNREAE